MHEMEEKKKTWEEEMYWKHFHTMHFYLILPMDFHDHLVFPAKFADHMSTKLPQKVSLIGPSGSAWDVDVLKTGSLALVGDGWKGFAEAYALEERSLLLFKYKQNSSFEVLIFDKETSCEKEAAYFAKKTLEKKPDEFIGRKRSITLASRTEVMEDDDGGSEFVSSKKSKKVVVEEVVCVGHRSNTEGPRKSDASSGNDLSDPGLVVSTKTREDVPVVPGSAQLSPVGRRSCVSKAAVAKVGRPRKAIIPWKSSTTCKAQSVAAKKPSGNNTAKERSQDSEIMQTPLKNGQMKGTEGVTLCTLNPSDVTPYATVLEVATPENGESRPATKGSQKPGRKRGRPVKQAHPKSAKKLAVGVSIRKALPNDYISTRRPVTDTEKSEALERATKALTDKSFLVVMRPTCVYKRFYLNIPSEWMNKHLPRHHQKVILHVGEKTWEVMFNWYNRRSITGGLTVGWKIFALQNNLEEDDVCVFILSSKKDDAAVVLDVQIFRVVQEITPIKSLKC